MTASASNKTNIVLIGMPGCGKSTLGVILAKELGLDYADTDLLIQRQYGKLLKDIIAERGAEGFLKAEEDVCAAVDLYNSVIATGGSVVYGKRAMEHLRENGLIVYLRLPYETIQKRLADLQLRGVALKEGQDLKGLYEERVPLYEQWADLVIEEDGLDLEQTLSETVKNLLVLSFKRR